MGFPPPRGEQSFYLIGGEWGIGGLPSCVDAHPSQCYEVSVVETKHVSSVLSLGAHSSWVQLWAMRVSPLGEWLGVEFLADRLLTCIGITTECASAVFHSTR